MSQQSMSDTAALRDEIKKLTQHNDPDIALAAKLTLKHAYDEEVSL